MHSNNEPKNQHYLPKCYLKSWQIKKSSPHVYSYMVAHQKVVYKDKAPSHICSIDDFYTFLPEIDILENKGYELERFFSNLENQASPILEGIIKHDFENIDSSSKEILAKFILSLYYRNPRYIEPLCEELIKDSELFHVDFKKRMLQPTEIYSTRIEEERVKNVEIAFSMLRPQVFARNYVLRLVKEQIEAKQTIANLVNMIWSTTSYVELAEDCFITSDAPLIVNLGHGLQDENVLITLPLSPKKLLVFYSDKNCFSKDFLLKIAGINNFLLMQYSQFIISDRVIKDTYYFKNERALREIFMKKNL